MTHHTMTRRDALRRAALAGAAIAAAPMIAACGAGEAPEGGLPGPGAAGPERVVSLGFEDEAIALGVTLAAGAYTYAGDWPPHLADRLRDTPSVGLSYEPDLERVAVADPDVIVAGDYLEEETERRLRRIARTAEIGSPFAGGTVGATEVLRDVGRALGREGEAARFAEAHGERAREARTRLASVDGTVAFLRIFVDEIRLVTPSWGYIGPVLYGDLGLRAAPGVAARDRDDTERSGWVPLSLERIPEADADHLFFLTEDEDAIADISSRRLWRALPAVRAGRVHRVDDAVWQTTAVLANESKWADVVAALI